MQTETKALMEYTTPRLSRRQYRAKLHASRRALRHTLLQVRSYAGGLPAEQQSRRTLSRASLKTQRVAARKAWANHIGRPIDLCTLMAQLKGDGTPVWAIVDPVRPISDTNGQHDTDGTISVGGQWQRLFDPAHAPLKGRGFLPSGLPALPPRVRRLLTDPLIRRRAKWIGVLYQPESWTEVRPDPAVVVEWLATPGQYSALAVWGGDYHRIMEFVS